MKQNKKRPQIFNKITNSFRVLKHIWSGSFTGLSIISAGSLARWGSLTWFNLARKAIQNPYAYRSIILIAETLASIPLVVMRPGEDDEPEFDKEHDLIKLLRRPHPGKPISRLQIFCQIVWHLHIGGEFFFRTMAPTTGPNRGRPRRLKLLRPDRITDFIYDEDDEIIFYIWANRKGMRKRIPAEEILHVKLYNPTTTTHEDERGLPILVASMRAIELMRESEDWNKSIAQQKGKPPGVFKRTERGQTTDGKLKQLREQVQDVWKADSENSLPAVLPFGWDFMEIGKSLKDAEFSEGDKANMRKIAVSLGVDPALLGDSASRTLANLKEAITSLITLRVLPLLDFILDGLTTWFEILGVLEEDEVLTYQREAIEVLKEELTAKFERIFGAVDRGILTRDDARADLNKNPLGGMSSEQTVTVNTVPLNSIGSTGSEDMDIDEERELRELLSMSVKSFERLLGTNGIHKPIHNN